MAFDGAYRKRQSLSNCAVRQPLTDQHHDLPFAVGEWQGFAGLTKGGGPCTATLFGQRIGACRACQRRTPLATAPIREGSMSGGIDGGNEISHLFEFF